MDYSNLMVPEGFLEEEIRCDYRVSEKAKKIMAIEVDLTRKLLEVCEKHDIKVIAFAGTLLGTIRHKGFIPWDDDMDLAIRYEDFLKLEKIAKDEFAYPYFLQTAKTDKKYFCGYARLRNSDSTGRIFWHKSNEYNNGIYIDIYVLNGYSENKWKLKLQVFQLRALEKILNSYYCDWKRSGIRSLATKILKQTLCKIVSYEKMIDHYRNVLTKYDSSSKMLSTLAQHHLDTIEHSCIPKSDFEEIIYAPYEFINIPISSNYEEFLRKHYGNYMDLPPIEKRGVWHDDMIYFDPDTPYMLS